MVRAVVRFFDVRPLRDLVPAVLLVLAMILHHYIGLYYDRRFGQVRRRYREKGRLTSVFWVVVAGVFFLSFFRGWFGQVELGVLAGAAVAAFALGDLWVERHRLTVHWAVLAVLAVGVCLLPVFGVFSGEAFPLIMVPLGAILLLGALLDHLLLVRTLGPVPKEEADAGAV